MSRAERVASILLVAFGLGVMVYAHQQLKLGMVISPGAGFVPFWIGAVLTVLGGVWFAQCLLSQPGPPTKDDEGVEVAVAAEARRHRVLTRLLPGVALVIAYAWLFERAGFLLATLLFMVAWQKIVERERWGKALLVALICAGAMYALFSYLLKGVLPAGSWFG